MKCKQVILTLLLLLIVCLTACEGMSNKDQTRRLDSIKKAGYIDKDDKELYHFNTISDGIPTVLDYDYVYVRPDGTIYAILLYPEIENSEQASNTFEFGIIDPVEVISTPASYDSDRIFYSIQNRDNEERYTLDK